MSMRLPTTRSRAGLTLIEIIAAIALVGLLLSAVVTAKARHTHQLADASRILEATKYADALLLEWHATTGVPPEDSGEFIQGDSFTWRTTIVRDVELPPTEFQVVRLSVYDTRNASSKEALFNIDVIVPKEAEGGRGDSGSSRGRGARP